MPIDRVTLETVLELDLPGTHPLMRLLSRPKVEYRVGGSGARVPLAIPRPVLASRLYKGVDGLCPCARSRIQQLMAQSLQRGVELALIETLRAPDRQIVLWQLGATRTLNSKHEPAPPHWLGLAADLCPVEYLAQKGWNGAGPHWALLGEIAKHLGLGWGGAWQAQGFVDKPHVELERCLCG